MFRNPFTALAVMPLLTAAMAGHLTAADVDPREREEGSWITVSGTAVSPEDESFTLDYGQGTIEVTLDDWEDPQAYRIADGSWVTVTGIIDDGFFQSKTIDASSIYDQNHNAYFYANGDDERYSYWSGRRDPVLLGDTTVHGTVTRVDADDRTFVLDADQRTLTVNTESLSYNPLDKVGYQRIAVGDRVSVSGRIDNGFFTGRELLADTVTTTYDASRTRSAQNQRETRYASKDRDDRSSRYDRDDRSSRYGDDNRYSRDDRDDRSSRYGDDNRYSRDDRDDRYSRDDRADQNRYDDRDDRASRDHQDDWDDGEQTRRRNRN